MLICLCIAVGTGIGYYLLKKKKIHINRKIMIAVVLLEAMGMMTGIYENLDHRYWTGNQLERNPTGGGDYETNMQVQIEGFHAPQEFSVTVTEEEYSKKEAMALLHQGEQEIEKVILGGNASYQEVTQSLTFPKTVAEGKVKVSWSVDQPQLVDEDGSILYQNIQQEQNMVNATATLKVGEYQSVKQISFMVCKPSASSIEAMMVQLQQAVDQADQESKTKQILTLPNQIGEEAVQWITPSQHMGEQLMMLGVLAGLGMYVGERQEKKQKRAREREQLLLDYPQIISSLSLLISAGISTKGAWKRIANQYLTHRDGRPGYEEVLRMCYEMEDGVSELRAYENLGKRVSVREYRKLSMILIQNMTKGMQQLKEQFEREEETAMEERKNRARRMGEQASTKLLIPMMMLLAVVLMILIVPAMMQMNI